MKYAVIVSIGVMMLTLISDASATDIVSVRIPFTGRTVIHGDHTLGLASKPIPDGILSGWFEYDLSTPDTDNHFSNTDTNPNAGYYQQIGRTGFYLSFGDYALYGSESPLFRINLFSSGEQWFRANDGPSGIYDTGNMVLDGVVDASIKMNMLLVDRDGQAFDSDDLPGDFPDQAFLDESTLGLFTISDDDTTIFINLISLDGGYRPGDYNGSGKIDAEDLALLLANWGRTSQPAQWYGNWDGFVDTTELADLLKYWGRGISAPDPLTTPTLPTTIPEPATLMLIGLGGLAMHRRQRRRPGR